MSSEPPIELSLADQAQKIAIYIHEKMDKGFPIEWIQHAHRHLVINSAIKAMGDARSSDQATMALANYETLVAALRNQMHESRSVYWNEALAVAIAIVRQHQADMQTKQSKALHFSNCSIYEETGVELPGGKCDCAGAIEDRTNTPILIMGDASHRKTEVGSAAITPETAPPLSSPARCIYGNDDCPSCPRDEPRETRVTPKNGGDANYWKTRYLLLQQKYKGCECDAKRSEISLQKCALAFCHADEAWDMNSYTHKMPHARGIEMAKAVLDAANVEYIE